MSWLSKISKKYPDWNIKPPPNSMPVYSTAGMIWSTAIPFPAAGSRNVVMRLKNDRNSWMCLTELSASGFCNVLDPVAAAEYPTPLNDAAIFGAFSWQPVVNGSGCIQTQSRGDGSLLGPLSVAGEDQQTGFSTLTTWSVKNGQQAIFVGPGDEFQIIVWGIDPNAGATQFVAKQITFTVMGYTMLLPNN